MSSSAVRCSDDRGIMENSNTKRVGWVEPLRNPSSIVPLNIHDGFRKGSTHPTLGTLILHQRLAGAHVGKHHRCISNRKLSCGLPSDRETRRRKFAWRRKIGAEMRAARAFAPSGRTCDDAARLDQRAHIEPVVPSQIKPAVAVCNAGREQFRFDLVERCDSAVKPGGVTD